MDNDMTSPATPPASDTETTMQVPPEILLTIFENIQDQATLQHLRLVSSRFEELVTPIWRREVILTPELVAQYSRDKERACYSILGAAVRPHLHMISTLSLTVSWQAYVP